MAREVKAVTSLECGPSDGGRKVEKVVRFGAFWCTTCGRDFGLAQQVVVGLKPWAIRPGFRAYTREGWPKKLKK